MMVGALGEESNPDHESTDSVKSANAKVRTIDSSSRAQSGCSD